MQLSINGTTMVYEDHGAGPAVLLLHGFPFDRNIWKTQIQPLTLAGYRVIAPDLRGFGQSAASPGDYSLDVLSDDVIGLLNHLGIGRAAMVGLSLGAHVLNTLLVRYPQRVAAAVFVEPLHWMNGHAETKCLLELVEKSGKEKSAGYIDALAKALLANGDDTVRQWVMAADDRLLALVLKTMREQTDFGLRAGRVELPILRLRTGQFDSRKGQDVLPDHSECAGRSSKMADYKVVSESGTDITSSLLDFFQGVKRFRHRGHMYRQVA